MIFPPQDFSSDFLYSLNLGAMLPRHLRSFVIAQRARSLTVHTPAVALRSLSRYPSSPSRPSYISASRSFHSSSRRHDELPKSPFQTFVDVLRDELRKNRELQDNVKQLQGDVDKLQDSEAMKRAREVYERARVCHSYSFLYA
jgi:import inner membrane translocase subunit TIM44